MNRSAKSKVLLTVVVVSALVFTGAVGYLIYGMVNKQNSQDTYDSLASSFAAGVQATTKRQYATQINGTNNEGYTGDITSPAGTTVPEQVEHTVEVRVDDVDSPVTFEGLRKQNKEIYAWIYVPDTNINYPVLQSATDDNFYLSHDVYKNYSFPGAIYTQSHNKKDWSDRVTVLYGHNMASGAMFANLHYFEDKSFFDSHPYIYIYADKRNLVYQVVSAFSYDSKHILNSYNFNDDKVYQSWLDQAKNPHSLYSNVRKDVSLDLNSKMIVLSTCGGTGRYLVQGVLVRDERAE